ncbi:MAG: nucleotidyltransferase family protein [Longimicrobiaceae bacterium]
MDAMILAAGLGTRLRPLTHRVPKALVEVGGVPVLELVARRLIAAGADRLIVNVHHLGERVAEFVRERDGFGVPTELSREPGGAPLETGGGLLYAERHFRQDAPFFVHNSDILTDLPLESLYASHLDAREALATLAVMERESSRYLLFDDGGLLGWTNSESGESLRAREPRGEEERLAFTGVHVASPQLFGKITERGAFSIFTAYLRLVAEGERVLPFRVDGRDWTDIGDPRELARVRELAAGG